jgi:glycine/D-amino acid oxidase-like deaminating enzyme
VAKASIKQLDAVVIGSGIQGLLLCKRLLDLGQRVALIERSDTIAKGSSIKNHGWIHQGTTHSLSAKDVPQSQKIAKQLQYGHAFYKTYAPECFAEPLNSSYAITSDANRAAFARERWTAAGVPFRELKADEYFALEPNMNKSAASYFFEISDGRLHNRLLFRKLVAEIEFKQALILTKANYEYLSDYEILVVAGEGNYRLQSPLFFYATGAGTEEAYQKLTGEKLGVKCFKSQLLFMPRVSNFSVINIDYSSPIIVNHGEFSAINRSHDDVLSDGSDPVVNMHEVKLTMSSVYEFFPDAKNLSAASIIPVACLKPCIPSQEDSPHLSVDATSYEPKPGHIFTLPGKMTAAPYVTDELIKATSARLNLLPVSLRPYEFAPSKTSKPNAGPTTPATRRRTLSRRRNQRNAKISTPK